jgi:surface antigen
MAGIGLRGQRGKFFSLLLTIACAAAFAASAPTSAQAATLTWEPNASLFWFANGPTIMSVFQNGQCTELAANERPDVVESIIETTVTNELALGEDENMPDMDARYWVTQAQLAGIPTGNQPRRGALIVFQPGVLGAGSAGHIAYVQKVSAKSFRIMQMNAPNPYQVTYWVLPKRAARLSGIAFIY